MAPGREAEIQQAAEGGRRWGITWDGRTLLGPHWDEKPIGHTGLAGGQVSMIRSLSESLGDPHAHLPYPSGGAWESNV